MSKFKIIKPGDLTTEESAELFWQQLRTYGGTLARIIQDEADKYSMTIEEFLIAEKTAERRRQLDQVFELLNQQEYTSSEIVSGGKKIK